jgi:23S rRNA (guanosine2251-2'-O)-methyltransferase
MNGLGLTTCALLGYTPTPLTPYGSPRSDFNKTALGAEHSMNWKHYSSYEELKKAYPTAHTIALEIDSRSKDVKTLPESINTLPVTTPIIIIFGNEVEGVLSSTRDQSDELFAIPMNGTKESFNVSVSAGIALYLASQART